jgi:hypothetical protein
MEIQKFEHFLTDVTIKVSAISYRGGSREVQCLH